MPLVLDSSSPDTSISIQTVAGNASPTFQPPDSPLLVSLWAADSAGGTGPAAPGITSSPSLSWVTDGRDYRDTGSPVLDGQAAVFHALTTGVQVATSVTVTNQAASGSRDAAQRVLVFTGHDPVSPVGAVKTNRQSSGSSLSDSITATADGSWAFFVLADWNAGDPSGWVAGSGQTIIDVGQTFGISYVMIQRSSADGVATTATNFSLSGLVTGGQYHWVIVEIMPDPNATPATSSATDQMLDPGRAVF